MTDHPAVTFLHAVHQHAAVLAHQGLGEPYDRVPPVLDALAVRAARMNYTPVHPSALLRRIDAERETLAACRAVLAVDGWEYTDAPELAEVVVIGLAKAWGWEAET